jgi:branched-subunit amino acid ABC-type transport system permease component
MKEFWRERGRVLIVVALLVALGLAGWRGMGQKSFVRTMLSGLTLGALYFMVAAGLTLIFGLMDVLNFAHGAMFMVGAYAGWQFYTNPTFLFGLAPLVLALMTGLMAIPLLQPVAINWPIPERWQRGLRTALFLAAITVGVIGVAGLDVLGPGGRVAGGAGPGPSR